ncbi:MAG TPA: peptidase M61, partial [Bacteroidetes bacterium]|nr:peptidase M61 [Bacteroidota bacterium]
SYQFSTDLNKADNDKLEIELITPLITEDKIVYRFPAMIPGTYKILNFGYFIEGLKAFDKNGNELATNRLDINSWEISNSNQLYKLIYKVNDTFDDTSKEAKNIWPMAGTNIQAGKNFVFNNHGFFGYFDNYLNNEYII